MGQQGFGFRASDTSIRAAPTWPWLDRQLRPSELLEEGLGCNWSPKSVGRILLEYSPFIGGGAVIFHQLLGVSRVGKSMIVPDLPGVAVSAVTVARDGCDSTKLHWLPWRTGGDAPKLMKSITV